MNGDLKIYEKYYAESKMEKLKRVDEELSTTTYLLTKRIFDIICGFIGVICLIPLMIVIKICNLATGDKESIFYAQDRIGLDGKIFKLYKFRSMIPDAEEKLKELMEQDEALAEEYRVNKKLENDPRITKIGKFIRKTSLDETPQLLNVLKGDMSLIGNRPYLVTEKEDMGDYYGDIVKTKPGITGYWQVSGRSDTTFEKRLQLEQYYSNHANLKMDSEIFFKTFKVVGVCKGAK